MANETRVNLRHLLEDIRDSYSSPIEEVIVGELIANSLDSGASSIQFIANPDEGILTVVDNGRGMRRKILREYHNIAATTKERGKGIGFAGIGAKLSLLIAKSVITETKGGYGSRCATQWHLASDSRAPWKFTPFSGKVTTSKGTAVSIMLEGKALRLSDEEFIRSIIKKQYWPLIDPIIIGNILKYFYKKGVEFYVNDKQVEKSQAQNTKTFGIRLGGRAKRFIGFGHITKSETDIHEDMRGIAVSCFGKIIKRGWEWMGISPKSPHRIYGLVEVPGFSEILTTNKNDFLTDATSLKKYYRYRKAIQETLLSVLEEIGESKFEIGQDKIKRLRPLEKEIERTLGGLIDDFPELSPLISVKRKIMFTSGVSLEGSEKISETVPGTTENINKDAREEPILSKERPKRHKESSGDPGHKGRGRGPGVEIQFEDNLALGSLGRMIENTLVINTAHPAFAKAKGEGLEEYHIVLSAAWILSNFVDEDKAPREFINSFLSAWGQGEQKAIKLFNA